MGAKKYNVEPGQRFGKLKVLHEIGLENNNRKVKCICDCGETRNVRIDLLSKGDITQCLNCNRDRTSLIGQRFGSLTVVSFDCVFKHNVSKWICHCDCGSEYCKKVVSVGTPALKANKYRKCYGGRRGKDNKVWAGCGELSGSYWARIREGAKSRNLEFSININEAWELLEKQGHRCALTNDLLTLQKEVKTASLDRIDSSKGYVDGNIWWVHKDVNNIKNDLSVNELYYWANLVINNDNSNYILEYTERDRTGRKGWWKGYGMVSGTCMSIMKKGARLRNIEVNITAKELWEIYVKQGGRCAITNLPITLAETKEQRDKNTGSIDRIDSNKGYYAENVRWVHKRINCIKWEYTDEYFYSLCEKIVNYKKLQDPDYQFTLTE